MTSGARFTVAVLARWPLNSHESTVSSLLKLKSGNSLLSLCSSLSSVSYNKEMLNQQTLHLPPVDTLGNASALIERKSSTCVVLAMPIVQLAWWFIIQPYLASSVLCVTAIWQTVSSHYAAAVAWCARWRGLTCLRRCGSLHLFNNDTAGGVSCGGSPSRLTYEGFVPSCEE